MELDIEKRRDKSSLWIVEHLQVLFGGEHLGLDKSAFGDMHTLLFHFNNCSYDLFLRVSGWFIHSCVFLRYTLVLLCMFFRLLIISS